MCALVGMRARRRNVTEYYHGDGSQVRNMGQINSHNSPGARVFVLNLLLISVCLSNDDPRPPFHGLFPHSENRRDEKPQDTRTQTLTNHCTYKVCIYFGLSQKMVRPGRVLRGVGSNGEN